MIRLSRYIATWLIFCYRIYSITEIDFNDATPLLTYKATEKIKLSLVVRICQLIRKLHLLPLYDVQMHHIYEIWFPYQRRTALSIKPNRMFLRCYGEKL